MARTAAVCAVCGDPMPPGEEMFKFHGYSGPCPKPPLPRAALLSTTAETSGSGESVPSLCAGGVALPAHGPCPSCGATAGGPCGLRASDAATRQQAIERAYGCLWREIGDAGLFVFRARKLLLSALDQEAQKRGIAWAIATFGEPQPHEMGFTERAGTEETPPRRKPDLDEEIVF